MGTNAPAHRLLFCSSRELSSHSLRHVLYERGHFMQASEKPGNGPESLDSTKQPEAANQTASQQDTLNAKSTLDTLRETRETILEVVDSAANQVRMKPWPSIGIAAGLGLVLGLVLRRR